MEKIVKARYDYQCDLCESTIQTGEQYRYGYRKSQYGTWISHICLNRDVCEKRYNSKIEKIPDEIPF
jgi:hypothetical protein